MDETKTGTENTGGTGEGQTPPTPPSTASKDKTGTTSDETPTLTQTQAQELAEKAVNDALAKAGRDAKTLGKQRKELEDWQAQKDADELDRYKDDPEKMDVAKERQQLRKDKAAHAAEIQAANDAKLEVTCFKIATAQGVKPEDLKEAAEKYNLTSEDLIEDLAKRMAAGGAGDGTPPPKTPPKRPDSGRNLGGTDTSDLSPDEKIKRGLEAAKNKK